MNNSTAAHILNSLLLRGNLEKRDCFVGSCPPRNDTYHIYAKKILACLLLTIIVLNLAGCETVRKKFTRKKKPPVKAPRIYQVKKYEKKPTPELYKKHYVYWMSWHSELIRVLGENHKKDMMCIEGIMSNLKDMQNMLIPGAAEKMAPHITNLAKVKDIISDEDMTTFNKDYVRRILEKEDRSIKREFVYDRVKDSLKESFESEE